MSLNYSKIKKIFLVIGIVAWVFFGFILAHALGLALIALLKWAHVPLEALGQTLFNTLANIIIYGLSLTIVIGVPWWIKKRKTTLVELGLHRAPQWRDLLWLVAGAVTYMILTMIVTSLSRYLIPGANYSQAQNTGFAATANQGELVLTFISLVLVAPLAEEVLFRGYLLGKLRKYAPAWIAVILTAALFAFAHGQFNVGLDTFALGIVLCLLRIYSGSLWASVFLHMLKNGIAFYLLFVNPAFL